MVTFDEKKRKSNLAKHGIDLAECESVFDYPMVTTEDSRDAYGERRLSTLGVLNDRVVVLVWTERGERARLISCRYGEKHEIRKYIKES